MPRRNDPLDEDNNLEDDEGKVNRQLERETAALLNLRTTRDGRLEVAESVAATSMKVRVDSTKVPFEVQPEDLFDRKFEDPLIGIDDEPLMRAFKAHLVRRLPQIQKLINDKIPANPALEIGMVAQFVFAALAAERNKDE